MPSLISSGTSTTSQLSKTKPVKGSGVMLGVKLGSGVAVDVAVLVMVGLAVGLATMVAVGVSLAVAVAVGVAVSVGVGVALGDKLPSALQPLSSSRASSSPGFARQRAAIGRRSRWLGLESQCFKRRPAFNLPRPPALRWRSAAVPLRCGAVAWPAAHSRPAPARSAHPRRMQW